MTLRRMIAFFGLLGTAIAQADRQHALYKDQSASPEQRTADLVSRMTLEEKVSQMQNAAPAIVRLGVPAYDWWNEALHGVARAGLATVFPQAIGLAGTWDTGLEFRIASIISTEARAKYNDAIAHGNHGRYYGLTFWSPNINIFRDPRWGRGQETYGEDPYLTAEMANQFIRGMQGDDARFLKTIATSKHFAVHSGPERLRHEFNVQLSEKEAEDTYLYAFRHTVRDAKVDSIMCAYNSVDGQPACASTALLRDNLRRDWKFGGYVVSDCGAIDDIYEGHHYAKSLAEASALAVKAGTDLECGKSYRTLVEAVQRGYITEAEINRAVERLFTARFRLGMFDAPDQVPFSKIGMDEVASEAHGQAALEAAEKSMVLLKNERHLLPLENAPRNIAVIGPAADDPDALLGNYNGIPSHILTPLEGIEREFGNRSAVGFALGSTYVAGWTALVPQNVLTPAVNSAGHGLLAEYFGNASFEGGPRLSRIEPRAYYNWEMQEPAIVRAIPRDRSSVRWSGYLKVNQSGEYRLGVIRPECHSCGRIDMARVYVDDRLLTTDSQRAGEQMYAKTNPIQLKAGNSYQLRVEYSQTGGGGGLELVWAPPPDAALEGAVELARRSDVAILCLGLNSRLEGEESKLVIPGFESGDRTDIRLPEPQRKLVEAVLDTGKPVVVVLVNGSALAINLVKERAQAILEAWYGGQEAGTAIARTLSGKNNPAGRLPVTFYESVDQLPPFTDYSMVGRTYRFFKGQPLYPFGYGLSYSDFKYSGLAIRPAGITSAVSAMVANSSARDGDEVVEFYLSRRDGSNPELRGFERVHLKAGESRTVGFTVQTSELQDRTVSIGGGQPVKAWTGDHFVELGSEAH
ncbi:MAG: glycoside hydrolase family 3 C-terminal domain-containing protein [Bryobacteraceae bacterium]